MTCYCKVYLTVTWYYKGIWLWLNITRGLFGNWCYKSIWMGIDITRAFRSIMLDLQGNLDHDLILHSIFDCDFICITKTFDCELILQKHLIGYWYKKGIWFGINITRAFRPIMLDLQGHLDHDLILQSIFDFDLILQRHWLWLDIWLGIDIIKGIWLGVDITKCSCVGVPPS